MFRPAPPTASRTVQRSITCRRQPPAAREPGGHTERAEAIARNRRKSTAGHITIVLGRSQDHKCLGVQPISNGPPLRDAQLHALASGTRTTARAKARQCILARVAHVQLPARRTRQRLDLSSTDHKSAEALSQPRSKLRAVPRPLRRPRLAAPRLRSRAPWRQRHLFWVRWSHRRENNVGSAVSPAGR